MSIQLINAESPFPSNSSVTFSIAPSFKVKAVASVTPTDSLGIARVEATVPALNSTLAEAAAIVNVTVGSKSVIVPFTYQSSASFVPQLLGPPRPDSGPVTGGKFVRVQVELHVAVCKH